MMLMAMGLAVEPLVLIRNHALPVKRNGWRAALILTSARDKPPTWALNTATLLLPAFRFCYMIGYLSSFI